MESATCGCQFSPPVNDHPLDLAGALEDREDSGRAVSFRRSAARMGLWYQHGSSTGFRRAAAVSCRPAYVAEHRGSPRKAPQTPGISCAEYCAEVHRRYIFADLPGHVPRAAMAHERAAHGPTPRNAHGTLLAAVVPTRRRHGPDRPYHANGGKPAAVMSAAPWCPARGHYMEDVRVISRTRPGVTALAI